MAQVTVSLDKWLEGQATRPSILTRAYPLDLPKGTPAKPHSMMITAGPVPAPQSVNLPAGRYLFEAYLPNGDVATETVTIHDGVNPPIVLRATDSPHEWLSWQHLTGYSPTRAPTHFESVARPVDLKVVTPAQPPDRFAASVLDVWKGAPAAALQWTNVNVPPRPHSADPMVDGELSVTAYLYDSGAWPGGGRHYGLVAGPPAGPPLLAVLPIPWQQADSSDPALVDVIVDSRDASASRREWPLRISVVVRDNVMASVFGYLSSGDMPSAVRVAETVVDLLFQKSNNALAAAGAAYVLVSQTVGHTTQLIWVPWLRNLRNWFPWLPDGAILDGWAHLNGIGRKANVKAAAGAFVAAFERGIPFYSMGVKFLFEGLTRAEADLKANTRPDGFSQALEFARRMALRVDVRQPFTVVRLS